MDLYFIAILPPENIREEIKNLKTEIAEKYNSRHALKTPAHITLLPPFKREEEKEPEMVKALSNFAQNQESFKIALSGFGSFSPRVIFVNVKNEQPVIDLHRRLENEVTIPLNLREPENRSFHPHITLATRDLEKRMFFKAKADFDKRQFEVSFDLKGLFLLKHNGRNWEIFREFNFEED